MKRVKAVVLAARIFRQSTNFNLRVNVDALVTTGSRKIVDPVWAEVYSNLTRRGE
jgi:hypothetical protein